MNMSTLIFKDCIRFLYGQVKLISIREVFMKSVEDVMIKDVHTIELQATMADVRQLMDQHHIRHIPVVEQGQFKGMVTQKNVLAKVMILIEKYGVDRLRRRELKITVDELIDTDTMTAEKSMPLIEAIEYFLNNKSACIPVVSEDNYLEGILTSTDFVKLAKNLLK